MGSDRKALETAASDAKRACIVARKPCCGRVIYASAADPKFFDAAAKKELADMVLAGYKVEHMTVAEVRAAEWGCKCKSAPWWLDTDTL